MTIGIFGLGYVGLTTTACLLQKNFQVIGYEVSDEKREALLRGQCPLSEPGVEQTLLAALSAKNFRVAKDMFDGPLPDVAFICVGTPNQPDGSTDLKAVKSVFAHIQSVAEKIKDFRTEIVLRSTCPPGTLEKLKAEFPVLFQRVPVAFYPEFLREGTAMKDFYNPPQTVIGTLNNTPPPRQLPQLFSALGLEYEMVDALSAEMLKFACNAFHALKVCFGNEVGRLISTMGGDASEVMRLFVKDTVLNISPGYLKPGNPYGGSCLPKDTRAFGALAKANRVELGIVDHCESSNRAHLLYLIDRIVSHKPKTVAVLGLAFKRDTDDVRESASLELVRLLAQQQKIKVQVHDFLVQPEKVVGVNRAALNDLLKVSGVEFKVELPEAIKNADVIVLMHNDRRYQSLDFSASQVMDVARWQNI